MSDLSTFAGQAEHYADVRRRLGWPAPKPRAMRLRGPAAPPEPVEEDRPNLRDFLFVTLPADPESVARNVLFPPWKIIVGEVAKKHGLTITQIVGSQRSFPIVLARHEACYRMAHETTMSLPQIGRRLGGRDHTTILHGIRRHAERQGLEPARMPAKTKEPVFGAGGWQ